VFLVINILMPSFLLLRSSSIVSKVTWDPTFYSQTSSFEAVTTDPIFEIANFYQQNINDSHVTITYGMQRLTYLLQRSFIDLSWIDQTYLLSPILKYSAPDQIINALVSNNMTYFLLPAAGNSYHSVFWSDYSRFELFKMIEQQQILLINGQMYSFVLLKEFNGAQMSLYELHSMNIT
jgi:hypothetical protein